jgi:hypothetical protein
MTTSPTNRRLEIRALLALLSATLLLTSCSEEPQPTVKRKPQANMGEMTPELVELRGSLVDILVYNPDGFDRARRLATLLPTLGPEAVVVVRSLLSDGSIELGGAEIDLLVRFWSTHDPESAGSWALSLAPISFRDALTIFSMELWAIDDPEGAAETVEAFSMLPGRDTSVAQNSLIYGWYKSGKPGLSEYIANLGVGYERQRALSAFARMTIRYEGPAAIKRWAEALPDDNEKYKLAAFRKVGAELALADPAAAASWCDKHCDGPYGSRIRTLVAQRWASHDGAAAMAWGATLSDETPNQKATKVEAVKGAWRGWARVDRVGISEWIEGIGTDGIEPWLQPAIELYCMVVVRTDPARAMEWIAAIDEKEMRERIFITRVTSWRRNDPEAADAWMATSDLPEDLKLTIRQFSEDNFERADLYKNIPKKP